MAWCTTAWPADADTVARGRYLATAADCVSCHSVAGRPPFSGGRAFRTSFGILYSPNITPDIRTGIGNFTDQDFLRAMHDGRGRHGEFLYPAFPFTAFTQMSDADVLAIKAYLFTLRPVEQATTANELRYPYSFRPLLRVWDALNFTPGRFQPEPDRSAQYNRGKYLAESVAHCDECHTPRGRLGGLDRSRHLAGGSVDGWDAFNVSADPVSGIGAWSEDEIVAYLSTGHVQTAQAAGPMAEVVGNSLRFLSREDVRAMAVYLKAQPAMRRDGSARSRQAYGQADRDLLDRDAGRGLYVAACAACHGLSGLGLPDQHGHPYPSLVGNSVLGAGSAQDLVLTILNGVQRDDDAPVFMPPFGPASMVSNTLTDAQIATLTNYLRRQFGNADASPVIPADVARWAGR
jgi:mono/diheme cytochrome c family protein